MTYNFALCGTLLNRKQDDELARQARGVRQSMRQLRQVFMDMEEDGRFHPALLRLQRGEALIGERFLPGFLDSYFELKEVDATPNRWNLLKAWHVSCKQVIDDLFKGVWLVPRSWHPIRQVTRTFWQISVNFKRHRRASFGLMALRKRVAETRAGLAAGLPSL